MPLLKLLSSQDPTKLEPVAEIVAMVKATPPKLLLAVEVVAQVKFLVKPAQNPTLGPLGTKIKSRT